MASLKLILLSFLFIVFNFSPICVHAHEPQGFQAHVSFPLVNNCSKTCLSEFCTVPPLLRYGKYCGVLYTGCAGEKPCDGLDACCMEHDNCIAIKKQEYLSQECSLNFLKCVAKTEKEKGPTFEGNKCSVEEVTKLIIYVMDAALLAGRYLHKP
ncbi:phospholipase A2-alpha-like [Cornus florida]|uniref:phospholipase A2-alpha-like n=1 Tax=Cornus florida TaxID=4283 RepID=UPI002899528C|nr:phospholipase A2-alpha-like [Cornus florida]